MTVEQCATVCVGLCVRTESRTKQVGGSLADWFKLHHFTNIRDPAVMIDFSYFMANFCWLIVAFSSKSRNRADSCADNRGLVATVRGFDWQLGGLIDKDPPAIPVTAPVREPALFTLDVSTGTARSHPQHSQAHTPTPREQPKHLAFHNLGFPFKSPVHLRWTREREVCCLQCRQIMGEWA